MRVTSKGQVTIPQHIRERYGLMSGTEVDFVERNGMVVVEPATADRPDRAQRFVSALWGRATTRLSTDEIMRLTRDYDD